MYFPVHCLYIRYSLAPPLALGGSVLSRRLGFTTRDTIVTRYQRTVSDRVPFAAWRFVVSGLVQRAVMATCAGEIHSAVMTSRELSTQNAPVYVPNAAVKDPCLGVNILIINATPGW